MKLFTASLLLALPVFAFSQSLQPIPQVDGKYEYSEVVSLDSTYKKDDLYKNTKVYFTNAYNSANAVIQYDDRTEGKVIGKGFMEVKETHIEFIVPKTYTWNVYYTTEIVCKDGRYRFRFYDIYIKQELYVDGRVTDRRDLSIDDAMLLTKKGVDKKATVKLYNHLIASFNHSTAELKKALAKSAPLSNDSF